MTPVECPMIVASFNILNPYHAVKWQTREGLDPDGADNWERHRSARVLDTLRRVDFDICAIQELSERTRPVLKAEFAEACFATHWAEEEAGTHGTAIFYNRERLELLNSRAVRHALPDSPEGKWRCAALAELRDRSTGHCFRALSVHLKGYNPYEEEIPEKRKQQQTGDRELASYLAAGLADPEGLDGALIMGDFNEDAPEFKARGATSRQGVLLEAGFQWDNFEDVTESATGRKIDWILYRPLSSVAPQQISHKSFEQDRSASDHALTASVLGSLS